MEKKDLPPPYPGPVMGYAEYHAAEYPSQPVLQPVPTIMDPVVQQPVTIVHQAPQPTVIQQVPQPTVIQTVAQPTVIQTVPQPTVIQTVPQQTVTVVAPVVVQPQLREVPGQVRCTYCQRDIVTVTQHVNGTLVWVIFGSLCITGTGFERLSGIAPYTIPIRALGQDALAYQ
ncbi:hypothetical protein NFI96_016551, partial [Prochilodus magdalenae]